MKKNVFPFSQSQNFGYLREFALKVHKGQKKALSQMDKWYHVLVTNCTCPINIIKLDNMQIRQPNPITNLFTNVQCEILNAWKAMIKHPWCLDLITTG